MLGLTAISGYAEEAVRVQLTSNAIHLDTGNIKAGTVTFEVTASKDTNLMHELVVLKTDLNDDQLPLKKDQVAEGRLKKIGEVEDVAPGKSKRLTLKLAPGKYVLICNRPGHYSMGMHAQIVVAR